QQHQQGNKNLTARTSKFIGSIREDDIYSVSESSSRLLAQPLARSLLGVNRKATPRDQNRKVAESLVWTTLDYQGNHSAHSSQQYGNNSNLNNSHQHNLTNLAPPPFGGKKNKSANIDQLNQQYQT